MTYTRTLSMESLQFRLFRDFKIQKLEREKKDIVAQPYEYDFFFDTLLMGIALGAETNQITNSIKGDFTSRINENIF